MAQPLRILDSAWVLTKIMWGRWRRKTLNYYTLTNMNIHLPVVCFLLLVFPPVAKAFQEYTEPEDAVPPSPQRRAPTAGEDEAVVLPLGENTLSHNLGIPVLTVCTKVSDSYGLKVSCVNPYPIAVSPFRGRLLQSLNRAFHKWQILVEVFALPNTSTSYF